MKKYQTVTSYAGAIGIEVMAEDETDARTQAQEIIGTMDNDDFVIALDPQFVDTEVEEIEKD